MSGAKIIARLLDSFIEPLAAVLSPVAPRRFHAGRRACHALADIPMAHTWVDSNLARGVLASQWRSALLLNLVRHLRESQLQEFVDSRVRLDGNPTLLSALETRRPLIFASPHYGAYVLGCLALARRLRGRRHFALLYQRDARNAGIQALFLRAGVRADLLSGVGGCVRALHVLNRGGGVATMPDVFNDVTDTLAVPFFGRWLRVAAGTAFLARRSEALIVPGYVVAERGLAVRIDIATPIDARDCASSDERQDVFALTCRLFAEFERALSRTPEHWLHWDRLPRVSTPLELPRTAEMPDLAITLARRCRAFPGLLRRVPELAPLVGSARV